MSTVAIIQARYKSSRLPGKVMLDLGGISVLGNVIRRLYKCKNLDGIVVATRAEPENHIIIQEAIRHGAQYYTGMDEDVLDRYYKCAKFHKIDRIVRITADCPYIMPDLVDFLIDNITYQVYGSNVIRRTYPKGLDCEVFNFFALEAAWKYAKGEEREHVTPFIVNNYSKGSIEDIEDNSHKRLTLDTREDYQDLLSYHPIIGNIYSYEELRPLLPKLISTEESSVNIELGRV